MTSYKKLLNKQMHSSKKPMQRSKQLKKKLKPPRVNWKHKSRKNFHPSSRNSRKQLLKWPTSKPTIPSSMELCPPKTS